MLAFLNHWYNVPSLVMLGLVAVFFVLQMLGLIGHGLDGDHEVDADADADADVDADADADADVDHDVDAGDHGGPPITDGVGAWNGILSYFGVGKVPLMAIWVPFLLFAGFGGLFINRWGIDQYGEHLPTLFVLLGLAVALAIGLVSAKVSASIVGRFVDINAKGATRKRSLAGASGVVASATLDHGFGEVRVRDERGNEQIIHARIQGAEEPLRHGERVVLVDYDEEREVFWATRDTTESEARKR